MERIISPVLVLALLAAAPAAAQPAAEPAAGADASTQAARPASGALLLNIDKNREHSRVGLDYSLRWDFKDLASLRPGPGLIVDGVKALVSWDITRNTRLNYYGLRTNPWRFILSDEEKRVTAGAAGGGAGSGDAAPARRQRARKQRMRLSLSPLAEDLRVSFSENLEDLALKAAIRGPLWQKAGKKARRAVVQDLLSLGPWDAPPPAPGENGGGLWRPER